MGTCMILGHSKHCYEREFEKVEVAFLRLIHNCGVTEFWVGMRGDFDLLCVRVLRKIKEAHPYIKLIRVLSYMPHDEEKWDKGFDGSVYLLERQVPPAYAIVETNKVAVRKVEYIFSGVVHNWGGAWTAVEYAKRQGKKIIEPLGAYEL